MSKPERHWVRTEAGWQSHARWRCLPECECAEILMPPAEKSDEKGSKANWIPGPL